MMHPDDIFKNKLYNHETTPGSNVSFDKVMGMRSKKTKGILWKPVILVFISLAAVTLTAFFMSKPQNTITSAAKLNGKNAATMPVADHSQNNTINESNETPLQTITVLPTDHVVIIDNTQKTNITAGAISNQTIAGTAKENGRQQVAAENTKTNQPIQNASKSADLPDFTWIYQYLRQYNIHSQKTDYVDMLPAKLAFADRELRFKKTSPWSFEGTLLNAEVNYNNFTNTAYSVRGTHRFMQFNLLANYDLGRGFGLSLGMNFNQGMGEGEFRKITTQNLYTAGSHIIRIVQPGLPDVYKTVYDTTWYTKRNAETGSVKYQTQKISIPFAFRYHFGLGKTAWRVNATLAPGWLTSATGSIFGHTSQNQFGEVHKSIGTLDAKLALGFLLPVNARVTLVAEPSLVYQSFLNPTLSRYTQLGTGFGIGLIFKP
jgi:hypothetical protein